MLPRMKKLLAMLMCFALMASCYAMAEAPEIAPAAVEAVEAEETAPVMDGDEFEVTVEFDDEAEPAQADAGLELAEDAVEAEAEEATEAEAEIALSDAMDAPVEIEEAIDETPEPALASGDIAIDSYNFPDSAFRSWVSANLAGGKSYLTAAQAASVTSINCWNCYYGYIYSLAGIELFPNLRYLNCRDNCLSELDISGNPYLEELDIRDNYSFYPPVSLDGHPALIKARLLGTLDDSDGYVKTYTENQATYTIAFSSTSDVKLTKAAVAATSLVLGRGETFAKLADAARCTFESLDTSVATVSDTGTVESVGTGTTWVLVTDTVSGGATRVSVTVKDAPGSVSMSVKSKKLKKPERLKLKAVLPSGTASRKLTWTSSNKAVATVSATGVVTPKKAGKAVIKVKTFNGKTAKCTVTVTDKVRYRAVVVGQNNYKYSKLRGCVNDAKTISGMLKGLKNKFGVKLLKNATSSQMLSAISSYLAKGSKDNDVSVFYYSGHGCNDNGHGYQGALCGIKCEVKNDFVTTKQLATALKKVKGRVIVLVDACHSGAMIGRKGAGMRSTADADAFAQSFIDELSGDTITVKTFDASGKACELKKSKFVVLVAAGFWQSSYDCYGEYGNYWQGAYTAALVKGMGFKYPSGASKSTMPADTNGDNQASLKELYKYVKKTVDGWGYPQTTKYYASNTNEVLFVRK